MSIDSLFHCMNNRVSTVSVRHKVYIRSSSEKLFYTFPIFRYCLNA